MTSAQPWLERVRARVPAHTAGVPADADPLFIDSDHAVAVQHEIQGVLHGHVGPGHPDDVTWRVEAMRPQVPPFPGIIPLLRVRTDTAPGTCLSCGDATDQPRCGACIAAMHIVLDGWAE